MTEPFVAVSPAMRVAVDRVAYAAVSTETVLVTGEPGTGKERVAREIHARSERSSGPFVVVRCGSLEDPAVESELFGGSAASQPRTPNAFQRASGGTLVLDEIGSLSAALQVRVTAMLQRVRRDPADARIIATTSTTRANVDAHRSRVLQRQLAGVTIELPPLRDRRDDIVPLTHAFLDRVAKGAGGSRLVLAPAAGEALESFDWPGNVRQLEHGVLVAAGSACNGVVTLEAISPKLRRASVDDLATLSYREMLVVTRDRSTREYLSRLLVSFGGNVPLAAAHAGIERESFYRLLKRYALDVHAFRTGERANQNEYMARS